MGFPPRNPNDLAVVINSYNRVQLLRRALDSLFKHLVPLPSEVVVIDDHSSDGSQELVRQYADDAAHPGLCVVVPDTRVAFAGGVNLGITTTHAPYVCLFETDNVALDAGIWEGVDHLKAHPEAAAVGFRVVLMNGKEAGSAQAFPSALGFVLGQRLTHALRLEAPSAGLKQDVVYTSPLVLSRAALDDVGLMDSHAFPFCDSDIDWCARIRKAGKEVHRLRWVTVVHDQGGNKSEFSQRRVLDFHRARLAYFRKHLPGLVWLVKGGLLLRHAVELLMLITASAVDAEAWAKVKLRAELIRRWAREYR